MAIPATATFDLSVDELIEAACARAGGMQQTASELRSALRALNLVFQEITNRGVPLWQLELAELPLDDLHNTYDLPDDTVDVWKDAVIREPIDISDPNANPIDYPMEKISYDMYLMLTNKRTKSIPTQFMVERGLARPMLRVYPQPDQDYTFRYWRIRKPRDAATVIDQVEYPARWQPALVSGLAFYIGMERPQQVDADMRRELKAQWEQDYLTAAQEYVDRADLVLDVDLSCYSGRM